MKNLCMFLLFLLASPLLASAQNLEVSGGYAHISGDGGLDGFNLGQPHGSPAGLRWPLTMTALGTPRILGYSN